MRRFWGRSTFAVAGLGLLMLVVRPAAQQQQAPAEQHAGGYSQADIQAGSIVYAAQCANCHGPNGDLVGDVNLASNRFKNATTDDDLKKIVVNGLQGTSMIGQPIPAPQLTELVAFIRNMRDFNSKPVAPGDAARGQVLFEGPAGGCLTCHRVGAKGSHIAPDLSEIGSSRNPAALQQSMLDPTSRMMPINRPVKIVMKNGQTINGRRLNEDTYHVQLITDKERLLSVAKADVKDYQILTTSTMPAYKDILTPQQIADIVSYLGTLRAAGRGAGGGGGRGGGGGGAPQGGPPPAPAGGGRQGAPPAPQR
jgi:putative heme-binding domain-containing protein